jgi:hypothetical protein
MLTRKKYSLLASLMFGVILSSFGQSALASNSAAFRVNLEVCDSIAVSANGVTSGSNEVIQVEDRASGVTTYFVLD